MKKIARWMASATYVDLCQETRIQPDLVRIGYVFFSSRKGSCFENALNIRQAISVYSEVS